MKIIFALCICLMSQSLHISRTVNMGKFLWTCTLCLHQTKRKSNVIRHTKLIHGIDVVKKQDVGMNAEDSRAYKKFRCNTCLYNTVKKYNLPRHLKSIHTPKEKREDNQEDMLNKRHYTREEFEEILTRLKRKVLEEDDPKPDIFTEYDESEAKIREGYLKALEILTG